MINNTSNFLIFIDQILNENTEYFKELETIRTNDLRNVKVKILNDLQIFYEQPYCDLTKIFQEHIKVFIWNKKEKFTMSSEILKQISKQIEIDYLLGKHTKEKAQLYYSISNALIYYGIFREQKIVPFSDNQFWEELIKYIYLLNFMDNLSFNNCCEDYTHPQFNVLPRLVKAKKLIENTFNEQIEIIDGIVQYKEEQEEEIVKKIEEKLSQLNLFNLLIGIFSIYEDNKKKHNIELTIPYKYIINFLIKNIATSTHKKTDKKEFEEIIQLIDSFISLYQLRSQKQFEQMNMNEHTIVEQLQKQILFTNFYPIYSLKTNTLISYIQNLIEPSVNQNIFVDKFGFTIQNLIDFVLLLDEQIDEIIFFNEDNISENELKILELFSIDAKVVNQNYGTVKNLDQVKNIFALHPIIKYKNKFFTIGFQYFKLNFYNTLVERIRISFDEYITKKIGDNVDLFVENIFKQIQDKYKYEIFSGYYKPPKKENPESDLTLKLENDIIFIENKNKYLTKHSFDGDSSNILKDLILSFGFSQKQLLKHERNLKIHNSIKFTNDNRTLKYENQNIVKISISTNNWYSIMNNIPRNLLLSLIRLRFDIKEDRDYKKKDDFIKANKYLDELQNIIEELSNNKNFNMRIVLKQTSFLPLELFVEYYNDDNFIDMLKTLSSVTMNTDNILNIYNYCQYLESHKKDKL